MGICVNLGNLCNLWLSFLDLIYPRYCLICSASLNNTDRKALCTDCTTKITFINQDTSCPRCGIDLGPYVQSDTLCLECHAHPPRFTRAVAVAGYDGIIRDAIHKLKYGCERVLVNELSGLLIARWQGVRHLMPEMDWIMPAPLYKKKLKERGFNQSQLLAERLSEATGIPLELNNLVKTRPTSDQAGLDSVNRKKNLIDAFEVTNPEFIDGKNILLIDDVLTTGTTASEITRTLKKAGAKAVYVLVLAR
ncbi:MAG: ComF family protein [Planctomycetota bacterium]